MHFSFVLRFRAVTDLRFVGFDAAAVIGGFALAHRAKWEGVAFIANCVTCRAVRCFGIRGKR
jgi:hypothetical protein